MSVDAGLSLKLVSPRGEESILEALLASDWSSHPEGWWCVPVGGDASDWKLALDARHEDLMMLLRAKRSAGEVFGIRLWWQGGDVGGEFLIFAGGELTFSPSMNRVTLDQRVTDVSWYLARLLPVFGGNAAAKLEAWTWKEDG